MTADLQTLFTIGVYGFSEDAFFGALVNNKIDLFIDIRARRGVRGSKYKFVNSTYLQARLKKEGIAYAHLEYLAPTKEIRAEQHKEDARQKTRKRDRTELSKGFKKAYQRDILRVWKKKPDHKFYVGETLAQAKELSQYPHDRLLRNLILFCVEQHPRACHRYLVAEEFEKQLNSEIKHILP